MVKDQEFLKSKASYCLDLAKKIILTAKRNNADAIKIQTYTADTMTIKNNKKCTILIGDLSVFLKTTQL